jgi:hypothetical protein
VAGVLAIGALIVFSNLIAAVVAATTGTALFWLHHRRIPWSPWAFGGLFLAVWMLCGQRLASLPSYLVNSLEISRGYAYAMAQDGPVWQVATVSAGFLALCCWFGWVVVKERSWIGAMVAAACVAVFFLSFKHAFVRHQWPRAGMTGVTLLSIAIVQWSLSRLIGLGRTAKLLSVFSVAAAVAVGTAFLAAEPGGLGATIHRIDRNRRFNLHMIRNPTSGMAGLHEAHEEAVTFVQTAFPIPATSGPVDMFGYRQGILLAHGAEFSPRPVFQNFAAYTPKLAEINRQF